MKILSINWLCHNYFGIVARVFVESQTIFGSDFAEHIARYSPPTIFKKRSRLVRTHDGRGQHRADDRCRRV